MLLRSRRHLPLRRLDTLSNSIRRSSSSTPRIPFNTTSRPRRNSLGGGRLVGFERNLATALDNIRAGEEIPYEGLPSSISPEIRIPHHPLYELRGFEGFSPIRLSDVPLQGPRRPRFNDQGIPGQLNEIIALYDACLRVGRLDRAALVLKRIATYEVLSGQDMIVLHNRYLREKVAILQANPGVGDADELHKWFELQIRAELLPQTPETIAYMLKASFLSSGGKRLESFVERYMAMLPNDAGLGELHLGDILTDKELSSITQICPSFSLAYEMPILEDLASTDLVPDEEILSGEAVSLQPTETPEILSTPQKGMGLKTIKRSLSLFDTVKDGNSISNLTLSERREIQSRLERDCIDAAMDRWRDENEALNSMGRTTAVTNSSLAPKIHEWHTALEARLAYEFELIDQSIAATKKSVDDLGRCVYGPFLQQSTPKRLAAVTILSVLSSLGARGNDNGMMVTLAVQQISRIVEEDVRAQRKEKDKSARKSKARKVRLVRLAEKQAAGPEQAASAAQAAAPQVQNMAVDSPASLPAFSDSGVSITESIPGEGVTVQDVEERGFWPTSIKVKVGAALVTALLETAKITVTKEDPETKTLLIQSQPAFVHGSRLKGGRKVGMILANSVVSELVRQEPRGEFLARHLPMVVEPEPWTKWDKGGYLESSTPLVRAKYGEAEQRIYTQAALKRGDMNQVLKGMDVLGKTAWNINRPVLNVMMEIWNSGAEFGDIPALNPDIQYPAEPNSSEDPSLRSLWIRAMKSAENSKSSLHSIRCNMNFQMEVAKAFRDQTFYFPHNIDFRGRAYPIPTYLNHMGADHVRGLLSFSKGKEIGESGLRWLKVQLANVFGYDKASLDDREAFAGKHLEDIYDSALNPLTGKMWWRKAEDPWQCLATCFELKAALDSPDPTKFVSHLPVHQDGTCNGLQHYAALGGDAWGARQVNLEPGERPADVYSAVAHLVQDGIAKDVEAGNEFAKALDGKIARKVVKQTVMTNVYGVTFAGARKQIGKQIDDLYPNIQAETGIDSHILASYLARKVFAALSTMFGGAHEIQKWLGAVGGRVCRALTPEQLKIIAEEKVAATKSRTTAKSAKATVPADILSQFRSTIVWTTPLRMPVVQPYRTSTAKTVQTCLQELVLTSPDRSDPVNRRKQLQAFPPNFIHSLDASHMILSALECDSRGLSFAAVHDSFWTHAADIDTMNEVLRDAFVRIHSDDVIGRLADEFRTRYKDSLYLTKIDVSSKMGKKISEHRRSRKTPMNMKEELVMEYQRTLLLNSADAEERKKGEAMVTPASIFEDISKTEDPEQTLAADDAETAAEMDEAEDGSHAPNAGASTEEATGSDAAFNSTLKDIVNGGYFGAAVAGKTKKARPVMKDLMQVWLPLSFPPIPAKGDFDVRRLKQSKYFFS